MFINAKIFVIKMVSVYVKVHHLMMEVLIKNFENFFWMLQVPYPEANTHKKNGEFGKFLKKDL